MKDPEVDSLASDEKCLSRRRLLASLGVGVLGAYVTPTLFSLGQAHADHGRRHGSGRSRPSYSRPGYSRPSYSRPSYSRPSYSRPSHARSQSRQGDRYDRRVLEPRRRLEESRRYDERYRRDDGDVIYDTLRYLWPNS